ncbi:NADP-specific glutamate dehydrogenase [Klebsiella pneumoniae]|uniref:NADP-specific glutamate dehydrogenase n=1 Tax=Klebsiella pneumoniae TaxID=573 RepID=A0A2X3I2D4_KLEPN|nr:NADP-specific glutamate dehydrogenase [Klebsiella pneumoniae]
MELGAGGDGSDSNGTVVDEAGFTKEKLARLIDIKERAHAAWPLRPRFGLTYLEASSRGQCRWILPCLARPRTNWTSMPPAS